MFSPDCDAVSALLDSAYGAALNGEDLQQFLLKLMRVFAANKAHAFAVAADFSPIWGGHTSSSDEMDLYSRTFINDDPRTTYALSHLNTVISCQQAGLGDKIRAAPIYRDLLRPADAEFTLWLPLRDGDIFSVFALTRGRSAPGFEQAEVGLLNALKPHLARVAKIAATVGELRAQKALAEEALARLSLGVIVADRTGRIVFANMAAEQLLAEADGLYSRRGHIELASFEQTRTLRAVIAEVTGSPTAVPRPLDIPRKSGLGRFSIVIAPLRLGLAGLWGGGGHVLLLMSDPMRRPDIPLEHFRAGLGLTAAEARLLAALLSDMSVLEFAAGQNLSPNTVRTQMRSVMEKLGARRQSEVVRIAMSTASRWLKP